MLLLTLWEQWCAVVDLTLCRKVVTNPYAPASRLRCLGKIEFDFWDTLHLIRSDVEWRAQIEQISGGRRGRRRKAALPPEISLVRASQPHSVIIVLCLCITCGPASCNEINMWCMFGCCQETEAGVVSTAIWSFCWRNGRDELKLGLKVWNELSLRKAYCTTVFKKINKEKCM